MLNVNPDKQEWEMEYEQMEREEKAKKIRRLKRMEIKVLLSNHSYTVYLFHVFFLSIK